MATTTQPASSETSKKLINYRKDGGVAVIEMFDPPANTYTYEMNASWTTRSSRRAWTTTCTSSSGPGEKFFSAGANIKMLTRSIPVQVLLLPARERDAEPPRADAEAHDRRAQRPLRGRRPGDRHGRRHPHGPQGRRQDRPARSEPGRAARHRRHAAARPAGRQEPRDRADGHRRIFAFEEAQASASSTRSTSGTATGTACWRTRSSSARRTRRRRPSA